MDFNLIRDFVAVGGGKVYQGAAPDDVITSLDSNDLLLVEMAAGIDALHWVRQGTLKAVLYFGIDDSPAGCLDDPTLLHLAGSTARWLAKGGDIYFGCAAGISRSSYADCACLMRYGQMGFDTTLQMIRQARPNANPNPGFADQLRRLEKAIWQA